MQPLGPLHMLLHKRNACIKPVNRTEHRPGARTSHGGGVVQDGGDGPVALSGVGGGVEQGEAARAAGGAEAGVDGGVAVEVRAAAELLLVHLPRPHARRRLRRTDLRCPELRRDVDCCFGKQ